MQLYKKEKLTNILLIFIISISVSLLIYTYKTKDKIIVTQTVNVNTEDTQRKINLNTATKEELKQLAGVGDKFADLIIVNRPYKSVYDVLKIKGIGQEFIKQNERRLQI